MFQILFLILPDPFPLDLTIPKDAVRSTLYRIVAMEVLSTLDVRSSSATLILENDSRSPFSMATPAHHHL